MTQSDGQSDGKRSRSVEVPATRVDRGEHGEDQHESDDELDAERLLNGQCVVDRGQSDVSAYILGRQQVEKSRTRSGTDALGDDEENAANSTNSTCDQEGDSDRWVDVSSAVTRRTIIIIIGVDCTRRER